MRLIPVAVAIACLAVGSFAAVQQGKKEKDKEKKADFGTAVVLTKRKDDGPYGTSAYSFRYGTQDVEIHKNDVDLVFNGCGLLHVAPQGGLKNRIARAKSATLAEAKTLPETGWMTQSIEPEKGAVYVMEVDDGITHLRVKIHVSSVSETEIHLEWAPFRDVTKGQSGTLGQCTGKHYSG